MKKVTAGYLALVLLLVAPACKKSSPPPEAHDAMASADASPPDAAPPPKKPKVYSGKYTVTAGTMYIPSDKDWSSVKFKNDETAMLGDGQLSITIEPDGRVTGATTTGPLGAAVLEGTSDDTSLTATVRRKDPTDNGLTGTLVATVKGDDLDGTMNLAESNAAVVRVAKFEAKKQK